MTVRFVRDGAVATVILDDPATRNAVDDAIVDGVRRQLTEWADRGDIRVLVVTGAGGAFSSGGRREMLTENRRRAETPRGRAELTARMRANAMLVEQLASFPALTVAVIDGACVGAALGWACACDIRMATARATFITGFARVGLSTDFGTARNLARVVGHGRASDWLLTSRVIAAEEAAQAGLVSPLVDVADVPRVLEDLAGTAPAAVLAIRRNLADGDLPLAEHLDNEARRFVDTVASAPVS